MELWDAIRRERLAFAELLDGLSGEQWGAPTLCSAWDVRHVAAHLTTGPTTPPPEFLLSVARHGFRFAPTAVDYADKLAAKGDAVLVQTLREIATSRFAPPLLGPIAPLTDIMVHRQDVLIPWGIPDDSRPEYWREPLDFLVSWKARIGFVTASVPRLRYVATDTDWSRGSGSEVRAPARALALALMRRTVLLNELEGPGARTLRSWAAA